MKRILVFGASNNPNSINKSLAVYAARQLNDVELDIIDLNDFEMPIYHPVRQEQYGAPAEAQSFLDHITNADGLIISFAEHNGTYTTAFKNIFDWVSVIDAKLWQNKPLFILATSPGERGGESVLNDVEDRFPFMGGNIVARYSLPLYNAYFSDQGISDSALAEKLQLELNKFTQSL